MPALPAHIRDQIFTYAQSHLGNPRANAAPNAVYTGIGSAILRDTEYAGPEYNLVIRQIVNNAAASLQSGGLIESIGDSVIDKQLIPQEYGPDLQPGQIRYKVRIEGFNADGTRKLNTTVSIRSTEPLSANEIDIRAKRCVADGSCLDTNPQFRPEASWDYQTTVIAAGQKK